MNSSGQFIEFEIFPEQAYNTNMSLFMWLDEAEEVVGELVNNLDGVNLGTYPSLEDSRNAALSLYDRIHDSGFPYFVRVIDVLLNLKNEHLEAHRVLGSLKLDKATIRLALESNNALFAIFSNNYQFLHDAVFGEGKDSFRKSLIEMLEDDFGEKFSKPVEEDEE